MIWHKFYENPMSGKRIEDTIDIEDVEKHILDSNLKDMLDSIKNGGCYRNPVNLPIAIAFRAKWSEVKDASHECWCLVTMSEVPYEAFDMLKKFLDCERVDKIEISPHINVIATDCQDKEKADEASESMRYIIDCANEKRGAFMLSHENEEEANKAIEVYAESFELVNVLQDGKMKDGFYDGRGVWNRNDHYGYHSAWRKKA